MSTLSTIRTAHAAHIAAVAVYNEVRFGFVAVLDHPEPPTQSVEAQAGAILAERGMVGALAHAVGLGLEGYRSEHDREIATLLMLAGLEAAR